MLRLLYIETGLELDDGRHLLAVVRRLGQGTDDGRVAAGAVQRLLDGQDALIGGRRLDKIDDWTERFIRMMHQDIAGPDGREYVRGSGKVGHRLRHELLIAQVGKTRQAVDLEKGCQIEQVADRIKIDQIHVESLHQEIGDLGRGIGLHLQPDGEPMAALANFLLNGLEQILYFVIVNFVFAVAG